MNCSHQLFATLCIIFAASSANAYVAGGHEYDATCNADGYILTSKYPVARASGQGAGTVYTSGIEKLYLGRSCDAFHAGFGNGQWCWANGGFLVTYSEIEFGFGRQELTCPSDEDLGLECLCE